jgi:hypothetical protein
MARTKKIFGPTKFGFDIDQVLSEFGSIPDVAQGSRAFGLAEAEKLTNVKIAALGREEARLKASPGDVVNRPVKEFNTRKRRIGQFRQSFQREKQATQVKARRAKENAVTVQGRVLNAEHIGQTGMQVLLRKDEKVVAKTKTDAKGFYVIEYNAARETDLKIEVIDPKGNVIHSDTKPTRIMNGKVLNRIIINKSDRKLKRLKSD